MPLQTDLSKPNASEFAQEITKLIAKPPPVANYNRTSTGPDTDISIEQVETQPVDGSQRILRTLSPFVFRIEPPLVYGANPTLQDRNKANRSLVNIYDRATLSPSKASFSSARGALGNADFIASGVRGKNPKSFVSKTTGEQFVPKGSRNEQRARQGASRGGQLGKPSIADIYTAADIALQLNAILQTPPLVMLINPQSLSIAVTKVQNFSDRSRKKTIFHTWGEEQMRLSISFRCGAFYSAQRGVQFASRKDSASWQNMTNLISFYKNNGYIYDTLGKSYANHLVGALSITYDGWVYYGNIESLSYDLQESNMMGGVVFEMEFVASRVEDVSQNTFTVAPMASLNPNPNDLGYIATGAQPNTFNVAPETAPLQGVTVTAVSAGTTGASQSSLPTGSAGFRATEAVVGEEELPAGRLEPFGF